MKKYKSILCTLLSMAMVISLTACGSTASAPSPTPNATTPSTTTGTDEKPLSGEIKFAFWDTMQEPGLKAQAEAFMAKHPGVKVTVETTPWDEYWTKIQAAATGGNLADIFVMHPDQMDVYAQGGVVKDLTELTSTKIDMSKFPSFVSEDYQFEGKQYGVPKDIGTIAMVYNKDIFDAAGVAYPDSTWTWDELAVAAEKLTDKENNIFGIGAPNNGQNFYWNFIWTNGGDIMDGNKCVMDSPEAIKAMEYCISFVEKGHSPSASDFTTLTIAEYFQSGKVAMAFQGSWTLNQYLLNGVNAGVAEIPMKNGKRGAVCSGMGYSMSAATKNPELAEAFLIFLGSEEGQTIQAETGICIPAYEGTQKPWLDMFTTVDASPFVRVSEYGHTSPGLTTTNEASLVIDEIMPQVFGLQTPVAEGMKQIAKRINEMNGVS